MRSGFTIVRNAIKLDFPVVPAIRSVLELCDEVIVNVGRSDDGTRDLIASIGDPRVRILDTEWDFSLGSRMLAVETQRAMDACRGSWGVYIQADEVLHEHGARTLADAIAACDGDSRVEGLAVRYLHFYGDFETLATNRRWYRREVRAVRLHVGIRSHRDAQGFRVGAQARRVRARLTEAAVFHYGWARPAWAIEEKYEANKRIWTEGVDQITRQQARGHLEWMPLLRPFRGTHPRVAQDWIAERSHDPRRYVGPRRLRPRHLRYYVSDWIERLTGTRLFEFRNYDVV
ncbi:MAG: hypothetical protein OEO21_11575 [Candidatus Krumholzibacteria bacterium]|nr:hypothetical protein [Candidatus Krumholzibacteria bacterium]